MSLRLFEGWHIFGGRAKGKEHASARKMVQRDARFAVESPLLYRPTGTLNWYKGAIQNVSPSGVLFEAEKVMPVDCPIEMSFSVPAEVGSKRRIQIFCWGQVARTVMPTASDLSPSLAAKIVRYRSEARVRPDIQFKTAA
jgi:hypothetical protein